jgi:hypothetical protein
MQTLQPPTPRQHIAFWFCIVAAIVCALFAMGQANAQTPATPTTAEYSDAVAYLRANQCFPGELTPGPFGQVFWTYDIPGSADHFTPAVDLGTQNPAVLLTELRKQKICPGGVMPGDIPPFVRTIAPKLAPPPPPPAYCAVGSSRVAPWGVYYDNAGSMPANGDHCGDPRGTFRAVVYQPTPMGFAAYWLLEASTLSGPKKAPVKAPAKKSTKKK